MTPPDDPNLRAAYLAGAREMSDALSLRWLALYPSPGGSIAKGIKGMAILELAAIGGASEEEAAEYRWLDQLEPRGLNWGLMTDDAAA